MNSRAEASPRTRKMPEEHPRKPGTPGRLSRSAVTTETAMAESSWDDDIELYGHHPAAGLLRDAEGRAAGAAGGRCRYSRFRGPDPLRKGGKRRIVHFDADTAVAIRRWLNERDRRFPALRHEQSPLLVSRTGAALSYCGLGQMMASLSRDCGVHVRAHLFRTPGRTRPSART